MLNCGPGIMSTCFVVQYLVCMRFIPGVGDGAVLPLM